MRNIFSLQRSFFLLLIFAIQSLTVNSQEFLVVGSPTTYTPGLFSVFTTVIGILDHYEKTSYAGLEVNFGDEGCYYDPSQGLNWWNYYFEPIYLGSDIGARRVLINDNRHVQCACETLNNLPIERTHNLIQKYIHVKPHIQNKVSSFINEHFDSDFIIGVHYRGTDKMHSEKLLGDTPRLPYIEILPFINNLIDSLNSKKISYKIFLATDEEAFLDFMKANFPTSLIYTNSYRSSNNDSIHASIGNKYQKGEDAVIDCLLLSKCDYLIRTTSNLSLCATYFNLNLPVIRVNKGSWDLN